MTHHFTENDLALIYGEVDRRVENAVTYGGVAPENETEYRMDMLQGVYCTLIMLADNWSEVRSLTDRIEEVRYGAAYI